MTVRVRAVTWSKLLPGPLIRVHPVASVEVAALLAGVTAGLLALTGIVFALLFLVVQFAATAQSPFTEPLGHRWSAGGRIRRDWRATLARVAITPTLRLWDVRTVPQPELSSGHG
jgi:hypothetical protein